MGRSPQGTFIKCNPELVSKEISTYLSFEHRIRLAPEAVPVCGEDMTYIPYILEEKAITTVKLLDEQGIWERADKGDWAHPIVMPAKPMHVTTDLSHLNKFIIPTHFPLPTLNEIFQKV